MAAAPCKALCLALVALACIAVCTGSPADGATARKLLAPPAFQFPFQLPNLQGGNLPNRKAATDASSSGPSAKADGGQGASSSSKGIKANNEPKKLQLPNLDDVFKPQVNTKDNKPSAKATDTSTTTTANSKADARAKTTTTTTKATDDSPKKSSSSRDPFSDEFLSTVLNKSGDSQKDTKPTTTPKETSTTSTNAKADSTASATTTDTKKTTTTDSKADSKADASVKTTTTKKEDSTTAPVADKLKTALVAASATAAATAITTAGRSGSSDAAAKAIVAQFGRGVSDNTVAEAFAKSASLNAAAAASVFAKTAAQAYRDGYTQTFGRSCARGFAMAKSSGDLNAYTTAVSKAIVDEGDDDVVQAYGVAFASAIASGGEEADALAEATAIAFCSGGSTATAFARAYSVALSRDKAGCLVLTKAKAVAVARCSGGSFTAYAEASVERKVLGLCGILEQFGISFDDFGRRL